MDRIEQAQRKRISVHGVVQGVGFRPFVYRLAHEHGLAGWVLNHSGGVDIEVEGASPALEAFTADLEAKAPPLARIERVSGDPRAAAGRCAFRDSRQRFARRRISVDFAGHCHLPGLPA